MRDDALTPTLSHREREKTLKTVTLVTVLRLFRQRPVPIVERALHNHRIPPVTFLIAYAAQLTDNHETMFFMQA